MDIPQEAVIAVAVPLAAWLLLKAVNELKVFLEGLKRQYNRYDIENIYRLAWSAGEQLIAKHGITDRAQVEQAVLKFANEYMIYAGMPLPGREMAEMLIRAIGREYNEQRKGE